MVVGKATILTEMLIEGGILTPHIQGVQKVCLLTMAGVHHGTHEEIRLARFWRESSTELKLLQDPSYELFAHQYLPAVFNILKVASFHHSRALLFFFPLCFYPSAFLPFLLVSFAPPFPLSTFHFTLPLAYIPNIQ